MHIHLCKLAIRAVCTTGKIKFDRNGGPWSGIQHEKSVYLGELDGLVTIKVIIVFSGRYVCENYE